MSEFIIETSPLGRVVIAPSVPSGYGVAYTTRDFDGRLDPIQAGLVTAWVLDRFGAGGSLTTCHQVHGQRAERADPDQAWRECQSCDALWTDQPNVVLGIKVADCLPVSMVDPIHHVIANIHSGWRGTAQQITDATFEKLEQSTSFSASEASAWLGPAIRVCCFEVGEEVVQALSEKHSDIERFVDRSRAKPHVDVAGLTAARLAARGFHPQRIHDSGLCTRCDGSIFHSYRRSPDGGRNLALTAQ